MKAIEIKKNIYWVGGIDWDLREFHGYKTPRGTTYNAYLIIDEKIVLVDTVKSFLKDEMLSRIKSIIDPKDIDIVISNHSEMDHSGALPDILKICPKASLICSPNGETNLKKHFDTTGWNFKVVNTNDKINIGKRTLSFLLMQLVHWPDSMATYIEEDKILMPNDAFGQHIASYERFADEMDFDIVFEETKKYYANILMPYSRPIGSAISGIEKLDIQMIAPSHGLIFRDKIDKIIKAYKSWDTNETSNKAVIVYDSMWGSTKKIALAIYKAFEDKNIKAELQDLKKIHSSDIMTYIIDAKYICVGSPTLNSTILPSVGAFLIYLKGLKPQNRIGLSFGSYGWGGQSVNEIESYFKILKYDLIDAIKFQYVPKEEDLEKITNDLKNKL